MTTLFPLNVIVELLVNGTWVDITPFVRERDTITITGGNSDTGASPQPAQMTITLDNTDGRFSPTFTGGAYYPHLTRNNQIRVSINDTSASGNVYNGYRFWGEVPDWPPLTDLSGRDIYVQITATGPLRRINQGGGEGSSLQRYYSGLTGLSAPIAYWTCEEDPSTGLIGTGVQGGANMTVVSGTPKFKAVSKFNGSKPIAVINQSTWTGTTGAFGSSGDDLFIAPGTYQWIASTATVNVKTVAGGGGGSKGQAGSAIGGAAGAGGEWAGDAAVVVTPGSVYTLTVGAGGGAGSFTAGGSNGQASVFAGDAVTVTSNGGGGAQGGPGAGQSTGGTGSTNSVHHNGGNGAGHPGSTNPGAGGGGSGGSALAGNAGSAAGGSGGTGGAAVAGGGAGGTGGDHSGANPTDGQAGGGPGGGGGGGWANSTQFTNGGAGAPGSVELVYTASGGGTQPNNNVIRFIMWCPQWGGNNARVVLRTLTSSTGIARLDFSYRTGGNIRLIGFNNVSAQVFDSGNLSVGANNQTLMVSIELAKSGTAVAWALSAIIPGAQGVVNKTSGSIAATSMGSVSQVIVDPNNDVTKTAIGHISVQYALIPLYQVSEALNGHHTEAGVDRFLRLANEQALGAFVEFNEAADHWGFESGTQSWTAVNGSVTQSATVVTPGWPTDGTHSLKLSASGAGSPSSTAPTGTSGQPILPGDVGSLSIDLVCPVALPSVYIGMKWYNAAGTLLSESDTADVALAANQVTPFRLVGAAAVAPATTAFCAPTFGDHHTDAVSTLLYADNVRIAPHMGPQTAKDYKAFLQELKDLDQGILKEAKTLWGLAFRTRIKVINQSVALTLDYAQKTLSQGLAPVVDVQNVKNDITVKRKKGSTVQVTLNDNSTMSVSEPPLGTGRYKKVLNAVAAADEQLAALAAHLLLLGTVSDERYPVIAVNLARCGITGNALAPLMSAIAGVEVGDVIQLNNLPFYYPQATTKQMVIGYTETINAYEWTIAWNCQPYSPNIVVSTKLRRW